MVALVAEVPRYCFRSSNSGTVWLVGATNN
jgi:hypothetical protein